MTVDDKFVHVVVVIAMFAAFATMLFAFVIIFTEMYDSGNANLENVVFSCHVGKYDDHGNWEEYYITDDGRKFNPYLINKHKIELNKSYGIYVIKKTIPLPGNFQYYAKAFEDDTITGC